MCSQDIETFSANLGGLTCVFRLEQRAKQRMTHKSPVNLLSPKACVKIGQWNVRTV